MEYMTRNEEILNIQKSLMGIFYESFALFRFQLDTLIILYIYNLGFFIYLYMFRTDRSIIRRIKRFNHTSSLWHRSLGRCLSCVDNWPLSTQDRQRPRKQCQRLLVRLKRLILLMMDRSVRNV
jgi:hypothetical protein